MRYKTDEINWGQSFKIDNVRIVDRSPPPTTNLSLKFDHEDSERKGCCKKQCRSVHRNLQNSLLDQLCSMEDWVVIGGQNFAGVFVRIINHITSFKNTL